MRKLKWYLHFKIKDNPFSVKLQSTDVMCPNLIKNRAFPRRFNFSSRTN